MASLPVVFNESLHWLSFTQRRLQLSALTHIIYVYQRQCVFAYMCIKQTTTTSRHTLFIIIVNVAHEFINANMRSKKWREENKNKFYIGNIVFVVVACVCVCVNLCIYECMCMCMCIYMLASYLQWFHNLWMNFSKLHGRSERVYQRVDIHSASL